MPAPMPTRTKTERRAVAKQARRYGFCRYSETRGEVRCPLCRKDLAAPRYIDYAKGRYETWSLALDRAVMAHLEDTDEPCTGAGA